MKINGLPVVDAKKSLSVNITPGDIRLGNIKNPDNCAAARACKRQLGATEAKVRIEMTYIRMGDKWVRYHTPRALRTEIIKYDLGQAPSPGTYQFKPVRISHKLGIRQGAAIPVRRGKSKRSKPTFIQGIRGFNYGARA